MANPQKENGYTAIANELYDAMIRWHFSSYEYRVLIFIIRKTYGFNKKEDWISLSQFVGATMIRESHVSRTLGLLLKQNIITKGGNRIAPIWRIQKDYDKWKQLPKGVRSHHVLQKGVIGGVKGGISERKRGGTQKTLLQKTLLQKTGADAQEIKEFIDLFKTINPIHERLFANLTERSSASRLIKKFGFEKMKNMMLGLSEILGRPYAPRISTPYELEKNLGKLLQFIAQNKKQEVKIL